MIKKSKPKIKTYRNSNFYEISFLHKTILNNVSIGVHSNDFKKIKLNFKKITFMKDRYYKKVQIEEPCRVNKMSYLTLMKVTRTVIEKNHF